MNEGNKTTLNIFDVSEENKSFTPTIQPGIHEVEYLGHELNKVDNEKGTTFLSLHMANLHGTTKYEWKIYLTDKAMPHNFTKVRHICDSLFSKEEAAKNTTGSTEQEVLTNALASLKGLKSRMVFNGEEFLNQEGELRVKTVIGFPIFCESLEVPQSETGLRFDINNPRNMRRLPKEVVEASKKREGNDGSQKEINDLSF